MKTNLSWIIGCLMVFILMIGTAFEATAQNKVVVIPLTESESSGNATVDDVLKGKTFSNSTDTGLTGERPAAPVEKTGQTSSYRSGDDGTHQAGEPLPTPRFFHVLSSSDPDIVIDNLTGLAWQRGETVGRTWNQAIDDCNGLILFSGQGPYYQRWDDWRLPNVKELQSLIHYKYYSPALSNSTGTGPAINGDPFYFTMPITAPTWSSTAASEPSDRKWFVHLLIGDQERGETSSTYNVRCVHD